MLARIDVVAQPQVHGVTQVRLVGPAGERDLGDQLRLDPVDRFVGRHRAVERRAVDGARAQHLRDARQLAIGEAAADVADVAQLRVGRLAGEGAEHQRAEVLARLARLGPAADDQRLDLLDLQLDPRRAAPIALVARVGALGDEPFPALFDRARIEAAAVAGGVLAVPHLRGPRRAEDAFEPGAAVGEDQRAQVLAAVAQDVEGDERGPLRRRLAGDVAFALEVHAALQLLEAARLAAGVERDDLAVEEDRGLQPQRELAQALDHFRELRRLVVAVPRPQPDARLAGRRLQRDQRPDPVELGLVDQGRVLEVLVGRRVGRAGGHRPDQGRVVTPDGGHFRWGHAAFYHGRIGQTGWLGTVPALDCQSGRYQDAAEGHVWQRERRGRAT